MAFGCLPIIVLLSVFKCGEAEAEELPADVAPREVSEAAEEEAAEEVQLMSYSPAPDLVLAELSLTLSAQEALEALR